MNPYGGLLSPEEQTQSRNNLLLNFGLGLLANSGPSQVPQTFGQIAGKAGMSALDQNSQYAQGLVQNRFTQQKLAEMEAQKRLPDLIANKTPPKDLYQQMLTMGTEYAKMGMTGLGVGADTPASVREYEYFTKLPRAAQDQFLGLKRQGYEVTNIAGVPTLVPRMPGGQVVPLSTLANEASGKGTIAGATAAATERAKAQTEAELGLGSAVDEIDKMRSGVKDLLDAPGFNTIYGASSVADPRNMIPGTDASNAQAKRDQLDAMSFGISIQKMKGTGSLSDAEGRKVSAAYTRATNPRISEEEARKAWNEVLGYLDVAEQRARAKAGQGSQSHANTTPAKTIKWGDLK